MIRGLDFGSHYKKYDSIKIFDVVAALAIGITLLLVVTFFDIVLHDGYVKEVFAKCNEAAVASNAEFCAPYLGNLDLSNPIFTYSMPNIQIYWLAFTALLFVLPAIPAFFRAALGSPAAGVMWWITGWLFAYVGFEDYLYFALRDMPLPAMWPWLDQHVFISMVSGFITPGQSVSLGTLYASMGAGVGLLALMWWVAKKTENTVDG